MTKDQVFVEVQTIFKDVFDDGNLTVAAGTNAEDIEEWDSLEQINLIVAMENKFKIKFTIDEVSQLNNVGEMVLLIKEKIEYE
ncbi:acyl carrier protein [Lysinibacillus fusiformis]|uniref:acyl carrier protein n=1 Tax=Lysinibacillus fusiformis TaxID=28031 RepID=UPI003805EC73